MTIAAGVFLWCALPGKAGSLPSEPGEVARTGEARESERPATRPARSPWSDRPCVIALVLIAVQAFVFFQLLGTFPLYLNEQRGLPENVIGLLFAVNTVLIVLIEMPLIHRTEHLPPLLLIGVSSLFIGFGFGLMPYAFTITALVGSIVLWTIGEMLSAPMMTTWVSNRSDIRNRGRYMAAHGMCFSVAHIASPLIGMRLYERVGPDSVWHVCIVLGVVSFGGFVWLRHRTDAESAGSARG